MTRTARGVAAAAALLSTTVVGPAAAAPSAPPAQLCGSANAVTVVYTHPSLGWSKPVTRMTFTKGGCASAWATGQMTSAAITKQCQNVLQPMFPLVAYGNLIENQGDCIRIMGGLSRGEIDPGPVDPFPYR